MSEQEKFLARWSRRKREGGADEPAVKPDTLPEKNVPSEASTTAPAKPAEESEAQVDLTELPSLDAITAETDIRGFLKPGVPADLSRAALRRAWATDPAIRDFIGLSENSWDFNNNEMQGFGPLEPSDNLRRLLAQAIGEPEPADPPEHASHPPEEQAAEPPATESTARGASEAPAAVQSSAELQHDMLQQHNRDVAMQQDETDQPVAKRRRSGSALPT